MHKREYDYPVVRVSHDWEYSPGGELVLVLRGRAPETRVGLWGVRRERNGTTFDDAAMSAA